MPSLAGTDPATLSRRRKAALVVRLLLSDGRKLALNNLPEDVQLNLTRELGTLPMADRGILSQVVQEFADQVEQLGVPAMGGVDKALAALAGQISPAAAARLRAESAGTYGSDPWVQIIELEPAELLPIMQDESTEVAAVTLSKLPVSKAAEVLGRLPGERARRITYAMSQTASVLPEAVSRIGQALAAEHCTRPAPAFPIPASNRVGAILNSAQSQMRDSVLDGLHQDDAPFAEEVRRAIFTFPDIPTRVAPTDIPKLAKSFDQEELVTALAAAAGAGGPEGLAGDYILSNMSKRMAEQLREEIAEKGRIRKGDGEAAMQKLVTLIRDRADAGDIELSVPDEAE
ncbi:FliG C-terminal domain-containing protein [Pseudoroseicyclus aestuarii]|uniref:Flagellar motor switch protein FliG n=1 Tax=Pseudoroseicyclus aestuarii TaxID=1795041 RepID=A0A318T0B5_9RHOB|nr:FliG C-terminal domain-containing protein [Pseudoroseicyclus aestuarii]PYE85497.1 flagellar motor switch protein FliG [Pseudoroseicyclus aestuarii]